MVPAKKFGIFFNFGFYQFAPYLELAAAALLSDLELTMPFRFRDQEVVATVVRYTDLEFAVFT